MKNQKNQKNKNCGKNCGKNNENKENSHNYSRGGNND